jgi:hypothetical protein
VSYQKAQRRGPLLGAAHVLGLGVAVRVLEQYVLLSRLAAQVQARRYRGILLHTVTTERI